MEKRAIAPTLKAMRVGDKETFPISQATAISSTIYNHLVILRADGYKWKLSRNLESKLVTVTRVQ